MICRSNKYHNRKIERDGEKFDSVREYKRFCELRLLERAGVIRDLRRQVPYNLIPAQYVDGRCVERAVNYIADFVYCAGQVTVVEDTKGVRTPEYIIKRKLMLYVHKIRIVEV